MKQTIIRQSLIVALLFVFFTSTIPVIPAEDQPEFSREDCDCLDLTNLRMNTTGGYRLDPPSLVCHYTENRTTSGNVLRRLHIYIVYYPTFEETKEHFQTKVEDYRPQTTNDPDLKVITFEDTSTRFSYLASKKISETILSDKALHFFIYQDHYLVDISGGGQFGSDAEFQAVIASAEQCAITAIQSKTMGGAKQISGTITGFGVPLRHIKVALLDGENITEKTTDENGYFQFTGMFTKGSPYALVVDFSYAINQTTYFSLHFRENSSDVVGLDREFTYSSDSDLKQDMQMEKELPLYYGGDWAKTFASMYVHFTEALEFFTKGASVDLNFQLPLDIYTFVPKSIGTRYWYDTPGKSYITIESNMSIHESIYRPMNREYHEFCHYVMHALYRKWPAPAPGLPVTIEERNHGGYLNPSTSDSYVEGFATFMPAVIMEFYEQAGTTIPMIPPNEKDMSMFDAMDYMYNTQWNGKEVDDLAWANNGRAEETAVAGVLWDLFDDSTDYCGNKTPAEIYQLYQQMLPEIQQDYEEFKADVEKYNLKYGYNDTPQPFVLNTLQDFENYKYDDDNATLGFEAVWDVIKTFHNDFTSVYNDFILKYPAQKQVIDEVFITHAFYADTNPGDGNYTGHDAYRDENHNRQHDAGEYFVDYPIGEFHYTVGDVIGQATNYNRLWRKSVQEVPGYFIKVDNTVPFYLVKVSFPNNFYLDYLVRVWNDNGLINIPVPPEGYVSLVTVIPEGVQSSVPLSFASDVFHRHYNTSLSQGYYVEHDFQITGPIPSLPSMPGETAADGGSNQKQTPGFEVIMFLGACMLVFILLKKQRR